jgi:unsaturated chondroitin disaccharide hydrolase
MTIRDEALHNLLERVGSIRGEIGSNWPYHADPDTGTWSTTDDGDWCGGHWVECLRIAGELNGDQGLIDEARERTERLRPYLEKDDQFRGHRFYYSAARLYGYTGEESLRTLALAAAYAMRSMAMPVNGAMPIGFDVQVKSTTLASRNIVAIDNVHPNLRLDWWALKQTGDNVFKTGAKRHLDLTIKDFIRSDGSTVEFIDYDPQDGNIRSEFTLLGAHDESCWSRGQAWAISAYLRAWTEFGEDRYKEAAILLFDYWWDNVGEDRVPPWDFKDPALPDAPIDTSASAIVVEQLARMAVDPDTPADAKLFVDRLEPMLEGLCQHMTPTGAEDLRPAGMIVNGCFNQPKEFANRHELIWSTAYMLMALYYLEVGKVPD